ncbi:MAG: branched-chain amino acid ABC transporter permease [Proteobacteria bacterium]|nr:branched-chain amino acid ABC transporter permease [Pseudomonadota bacterium]
MEDVLQQVISGLATGSVYAIVALALVMIYQTTHHVNFAQGEMAMFCTYLAWALLQKGVPYWLAFAAATAIGFVVGAAVERVVIRPLAQAPVLAVVVVFIGLLVIFNSVAGWAFGYSVQTFPSPFGGGTGLWGGMVSAHQLGSLVVTVALLLLLFVFFRFTPWGLALRAVAENPASSSLVGIRVGSMLALGWGLASAIGAVAGMLVAPIVFLDPNMMMSVLLYAFAGAVLGGITSPVGAVVGGLAVGVLENLVGLLIGNELKLSVALALIIGVLLVRPAGLFGRVSVSRV